MRLDIHDVPPTTPLYVLAASFRGLFLHSRLSAGRICGQIFCVSWYCSPSTSHSTGNSTR